MKKHSKIIAILPAYNAAQTLLPFLQSLPKDIFDEIILCDDCSMDDTFRLAQKQKGIRVYQTPHNLGYGGNVKFCLAKAREHGADIMVEIHPDAEYGLDGIVPAIGQVQNGAKFVLGNRFAIKGQGLGSGMFWWKYPIIRLLTIVDNVILGTDIGDMHQGFRVYTKDLLSQVNLGATSDDYLFSFEIIALAAFFKLPITNVPVTTHYTGDKRGARFWPAVRYAWGTCGILIRFLFAKFGSPDRLFSSE